MRGIRRAKKGFSLIEVLISATILTVLLIPLASITITTVKTNKKAEDKQNASLVGQKMLEEMKSYDSIDLTTVAATGRNEFLLLGGATLYNTATNTTLTSTFTNSGFDVRLTATRNTTASYTAITPTTINAARYAQSIIFNGDLNHYFTVNTSATPINFINNNIKLRIYDNMDIQLYNIDNTTDRNITGQLTGRLMRATQATPTNNILIKLSNDFNGNCMLDIDSDVTQDINIELVRNGEPSGTISTATSKSVGNVNITQNQSTFTPDAIGDLYDIEVEVTKSGETDSLFNGKGTKNIVVN